jgi:hypothetical protein
MSRLERPTTTSKNPATKFLEWKSERKCFSFYNRETQVNEDLQLPLKFLFLEHYNVIKGWHDPTQTGIISNEVFLLSKEKLKVRTYKGLEIAEGYYSEIKDKVKLSGGVYHKSVYVMLPNGELANLQLKGAVIGGLSAEQSLTKLAVKGYSDFYQDNHRLLDNQWIEITDVSDAKKGATKYSIPNFKVGSHITDDENEKANECAKILQQYVNDYKGINVPENQVKETLEVTETDGLDF